MKILIGIPSTREDELFISSLKNFCCEIRDDYPHEVMWIKNQILSVAQNLIAEYFLSKDFTHLLFLDDDHWGHSRQMLKCLIDADTYMATIKSYSRHYPYSCALMRYVEKNKDDFGYVGIENGHEYEEIDLTGFPMTLLRRDIFQEITRPFFRDHFRTSREWATDEEFCFRLAGVHIKPMGCFQYCLGHDKVSENNVKELRQKEIAQENNFILNMFYKLKEQQLVLKEK